MSYCRWSSDNFTCDVYVYEDVNGGWTTHVARTRYVGDIPKATLPLLHMNLEQWTEYAAVHRQQMVFLETCEREVIGLPYDGQSFNDPTPGECADRLEELRKCGYNVPQYAIDNLREEEG